MLRAGDGLAARLLDFLNGFQAGGAPGGMMEVLHPHCAGLDVHKSLPSRKWCATNRMSA
jgi:hypothetical protein